MQTSERQVRNRPSSHQSVTESFLNQTLGRRVYCQNCMQQVGWWIPTSQPQLLDPGYELATNEEYAS